MSGRLRRAVADVWFYVGLPPRRWDAVLRSLWLNLVRDHKTEMCQECGRAQPFIWHAPDPLWMELIHRPSGVLCPFCFEAKAKAAGIWVTWTPMVGARGHKGDWRFTSNWWFDDTRDWLLMGIPDLDIQAHYPEQQPWDTVRGALSRLPDERREKMTTKPKPTALYPGDPTPQYMMPLRPPTGPGLPDVIVMRPFWVQCTCTVCDAYTLVDGAGEFECPNRCGCRVIVE